jgi:hypothetical protein
MSYAPMYATVSRQSSHPFPSSMPAGSIGTVSVTLPPPAARLRCRMRASASASPAVTWRGFVERPPSASIATISGRSSRVRSTFTGRSLLSSASNRCRRASPSSQYRTAPPIAASELGPGVGEAGPTGWGDAVAVGFAGAGVGVPVGAGCGGTAGPSRTSTALSATRSVPSQRESLRASSSAAAPDGSAGLSLAIAKSSATNESIGAGCAVVAVEGRTRQSFAGGVAGGRPPSARPGLVAIIPGTAWSSPSSGPGAGAVAAR